VGEENLQKKHVDSNEAGGDRKTIVVIKPPIMKNTRRKKIAKHSSFLKRKSPAKKCDKARFTPGKRRGNACQRTDGGSER